MEDLSVTLSQLHNYYGFDMLTASSMFLLITWDDIVLELSFFLNTLLIEKIHRSTAASYFQNIKGYVTESQNGSDLWRSSSPTSLVKQEYSEELGHDYVFWRSSQMDTSHLHWATYSSASLPSQ